MITVIMIVLVTKEDVISTIKTEIFKFEKVQNFNRFLTPTEFEHRLL